METEYCRYWIQDGILFVYYKPLEYLDLQTAQAIVSARLAFQEEEAYPIYCDTRGIRDSSKEARDYLAVEGSLMAKAIAIFDDREVRFMFHYYLLRNKPIVPCAVFADREEALGFLREFSL